MKWSCIRTGDIQIPEQQQLVMATPTMYGLGFKRANIFSKAHGVYFHMHQTSSPYHVAAGHNHYFGAEILMETRKGRIPIFWWRRRITRLRKRVDVHSPTTAI
jgi:hypothetical protein